MHRPRLSHLKVVPSRGSTASFPSKKLLAGSARVRHFYRALNHLKQTQRSERCTAGFLWTFSSPDPSRGELVGRNSRRKWGAEWSVWCSESAQPIVAQPPATTVSVSRNTGRDQRRARRAVDDCRSARRARDPGPSGRRASRRDIRATRAGQSRPVDTKPPSRGRAG